MKTLLALTFALAALALSSPAFAAAPTITSVTPNAGTTAGGQVVTIVGTNFQTPNVTGVTIGGIAAVFTITSDTVLTVTTPARAAGATTIVVTNGTAPDPSAAYTYVTNNLSLQVSVRVTIPKKAALQWGAGTSVDDGGVNHTLAGNRISPYVWTVTDPNTGTNVDINTAYATNDAANGTKVINVENVSPTNAVQTVTAFCSPSASWSPGAAAGVNIFHMEISWNGGGFQTLSPATATTTTAAFAKGSIHPIVLRYTSPTEISAASAGVQQICTVSLVATAN
jgi:hypothetical protein